MNFMEQLIAEWYTYSGYFVRTNIRTNRRDKGGYGGEIDVLALHPKSKELIHAEPSWDAFSWPKRKVRYLTKKFIYTEEQYRDLVGTEFRSLRRLAIVGLSEVTHSDLNWGHGIEVVMIPTFVRQIASQLRTKSPLREAVPESFPILRGIQLTTNFAGKGHLPTQLLSVP